jgi:hypothetical protein
LRQPALASRSVEHQPPEVLVVGIIEKERRILAIMEKVQVLRRKSAKDSHR